MNSKEAIKIAQEQKEIFEKVKPLNWEEFIKPTQKELVQKLREKIRHLFKDNSVKDGIEFIEKRNDFFTLDRGRKYAIYLSQNGSLKEQHWGMYMGNENIQKFDIHGYDHDTIYRILSLDFKKELIQQILKCKNKQDLFVEMFGDKNEI